MSDETPASNERLSLFMVEYRVTQLERTSTELKVKMDSLATRDDVLLLRKAVENSSDFWKDRLLGPIVVGVMLIVAEIALKTQLHF